MSYRTRPIRKPRLPLLFLGGALCLALFACGSPLPDACGTEADPCVWVFVPSRNRAFIQGGAEAITGYIQDQTGIVIKPKVALDFLEAGEQMCRGEAHLGSLNTFGYLVAHDVWGCAEVGLVSVRFDSTHYSGQILAGADAGVAEVSDLAGKTFCRPDPASTSGWIFPSLIMLAAGVNPDEDLAEIVESEGHTGVVLDNYRGLCETGGSFVGTRELLVEDFSDIYQKVVVIAESGPIPNDNISFAPSLSGDDREKLTAALLSVPVDILKQPQDWEGLASAEDAIYARVREDIQASGKAITDFIPDYPQEFPALEIPLLGPIGTSNAEISAMAWYGDMLILVPQLPDFYSPDWVVFGLPKDEILTVVEDLRAGRPPVHLTPLTIPLVAEGLVEKIVAFDGFEAVAFDGDQVYLTIEAEPDATEAHIIHGAIAPDLSAITLDTDVITKIPPQSGIGKWSDESLIIAGDSIITLYEVNGTVVNRAPAANIFTQDLSPQPKIPLAPIDYRITDATTMDAEGRFWVINYFFPGDTELVPETTDPIAARCGTGRTHGALPQVERLVELQVSPAGITMTEHCPVQLALLFEPELQEYDARNWEGIARLDDLGFLLVTDQYPTTILGFVEKPDYPIQRSKPGIASAE